MASRLHAAARSVYVHHALLCIVSAQAGVRAAQRFTRSRLAACLWFPHTVIPACLIPAQSMENSIPRIRTFWSTTPYSWLGEASSARRPAASSSSSQDALDKLSDGRRLRAAGDVGDTLAVRRLLLLLSFCCCWSTPPA